MDTLSIWTRKHLVGLLLAFTAGGFLFLLVELLLDGHWEGTQVIAPVSAGLGFLLALLALLGRRAAPVVGAFLLLSATGLYGTLAHASERTEPRGSASEQAASAQLVSAASADAALAGPPAGGPPWLAPLSLSGLALLGGVATLAREKRSTPSAAPR